MQSRKPVAKEAGCENTGPDSVQLSLASILLLLESPVSHSLWSESQRWQTSTAMGGVPQQTLNVWRGCLAPDTPTLSGTSIWATELPVGLLQLLQKCLLLLKETEGLLKHDRFSASSFNLAHFHFCTSVKQPPPYACCLSSYSENATIKHN